MKFVKRIQTALIIFIIVISTLFLSNCAENRAKKYLESLKNWTRPNIMMSKSQVDEYFEKNKNNLDPIEGIWVESIQMNVTIQDIGENPLERINSFRDIRKVAIIRTKRNRYSLFYYETLDNSNNSMNKFGEIYGKLQSALKSDEYIIERVTGPDPAFNSQFILRLNNNSLYGVNETKKVDEFTSFKWVDEYLYIKINNFPKKEKEVFDEKSGSGIIISKTGLVTTNYHVVEKCNEIYVFSQMFNKTYSAEIVIKDVNNDLCLLQLKDFDYWKMLDNDIPFTIIDSKNTKIGEEVYTLGFPMGDILGKSIKFSSGKISSLYGVKDDPRMFQISNPLQPGNSGGPLFNNKGEYVGIIVSSLNAKFFFDNADIIPQNVSFAIKSNYLLNLISLLPDEDKLTQRKNELIGKSLEEQIELLKPYIVKVIAKKSLDKG